MLKLKFLVLFASQSCCSCFTFFNSSNRLLNANSNIGFQCFFILIKVINVLTCVAAFFGKRYLASAIGYQACILGYRILYASTTKLFAKQKMAKADGSYIKEVAKIERQQITHT